jgi:hypothetical protein
MASACLVYNVYVLYLCAFYVAFANCMLITALCVCMCVLCDYVNICMCLVLLCIFGKRPNSHKVFLSGLILSYQLTFTFEDNYGNG